MSKKKLSGADKLTNLFDNDWKTQKSTIRDRVDRVRSYDPSYSWDGRTDNPQPFTRLQAEYLPFQQSKPITLSGSAVVTLENGVNSGFNAINVKQPVTQWRSYGSMGGGEEVSNGGKLNRSSSIPLTSEQLAVGMKPDLSGKVPILEDAKQSNKALLVNEKLTFRNNNIHAPSIIKAEKPEFMVEAGPQCDQKLLNPKQRREILTFEQQQREANKLLSEAISLRKKTRNQIAGLQFHRGVLMVDSSDNVNSEVYGERAIKEQADRDYKEQIHLERHSRLATKNSSIMTNGNILNPDSVAARVQTEKFYQSKGGNFHALSFDETHTRLFARTLDKMTYHGRTQQLRDTELSGKTYNITNHTEIEQWPSRTFDREYNKTLAHPSQSTLEGTRNLQGTLRPF
eukprot:gene6695-9184_t